MSDANDIVVGVSLPQTGRYARSAGVYYSRAYDLWIDAVNGRGGLLGRPVRLRVYDDGSEPERTAENYRRLIHDDHVDLLLGPCHSNLTDGAAPVVEAAGRLLLQGSGSSHELFRKGRRYLFLCWSGSDFDYPKSFLELVSRLARQGKRPKAALVYTDMRIGNAIALGTRHYAAELGIDLVFDEAIGDPPVDYADLMRRARDAGPDVVLVGLDHTRPDKPRHKSLLAAQQAGFEPAQLWLSDNPSPRDAEELGGAIDGVFMRGSWVWTDRSPVSQAFAKSFEAAFGSAPEYHSAGGYACCQVLEQAVGETGTCDSGTLREHLLRTSFDTVMGSLRFTPSGLPDAAIQLCQWQGGSLEIVGPGGVATAEPKPPPTLSQPQPAH